MSKRAQYKQERERERATAGRHKSEGLTGLGASERASAKTHRRRSARSIFRKAALARVYERERERGRPPATGFARARGHVTGLHIIINSSRACWRERARAHCAQCITK